MQRTNRKRGGYFNRRISPCGQEGPEDGQGEAGDRQVEAQQIGVGQDGGGQQGAQGVAHETRGVEKPEGAPPRIAREGEMTRGKTAAIMPVWSIRIAAKL